MPLDLQSFSGLSQTTPKTPPDAFIITEDIPSGAMSVTLEDTDMPHGRARELSAFQSGGKVDIAQGGIYNPGSERVVLQMMSVRENRMTIKGAFRDRIRAGVQKQQGGADPNHARYMRDLVERIKRRRNPLRISWGGEERSGVIEETTFDEEGLHDIAYSITFFIAVPPTGLTSENEKLLSPTFSSMEDLRAKMAADLAQRRAELIAMATVAAVTATISNALGFVANAIDALGVVTVSTERQVLSTPQQIATSTNNVNSSAKSVQDQVQATRDAGYDKVPPDQAMVSQSIDAYMQWWVWQHKTTVTLDQLADAMRQIRLQANQMVRKTTRLYRVQPSDTLESIALTQIGSKARASDLGIRADQLVPGAYVRIPQAS